MTERSERSGKRYACFTPEQQAAFDHLQERARAYLLCLAQPGFSKKAAYIAAGYKDSANSSKGALVLEKRIPRFNEFLDALRGQNRRMDVYKEGTEVSKEIDEKAKAAITEPPLVPMELDGVSDKVDVANMSAEQADRAKFYRQISNGTIKSVKITKTYDKEGNLTGKKVEETSDIGMRMKARQELDRVLGLNDLLQIGQISAGSITINIVDASKRDETIDSDGNVIIDGGKAEFVEDGGAENGGTTETK